MASNAVDYGCVKLLILAACLLNETLDLEMNLNVSEVFTLNR